MRDAVLNPRSSTDALAAISDMLGFLRVLPVPVTAIDEVMALLRRRVTEVKYSIADCRHDEA